MEIRKTLHERKEKVGKKAKRQGDTVVERERRGDRVRAVWFLELSQENDKNERIKMKGRWQEGRKR